MIEMGGRLCKDSETGSGGKQCLMTDLKTAKGSYYSHVLLYTFISCFGLNAQQRYSKPLKAGTGVT